MALKGLNRRAFEEQLRKDLAGRLRTLGEWEFTSAQSTLRVGPLRGKTSAAAYAEVDMDAAAEMVRRVFGIAAYARAAQTEKDMARILETAADYFVPHLSAARTFKCEAKRADKSFPLNSPQICAAVGERLLETFPHLRVDVLQPDVTVTIEVRDRYAFLHADQCKGAGGMPAGSAGSAAVLISGGIDSPVAAWMMAKRGLRLTGIHFASPPYTSPLAEGKVHNLLGEVAKYSGRIPLLVVPFTHIQEEIRRLCPEDYFTLIMRRMMMRIAEMLARREGCQALITGESMGQVASQTMEALASTDAVTSLPVFRPLIGSDKEEVVSLARKIGTFDISIQPYEDCCTVFTPRHPRTRPRRSAVEAAEAPLDVASLCAEAAEGAKKIIIRNT
jgi:thiamine biosynthesis protein ThiI